MTALQRERLATLSGLVGVTTLAWLYLWQDAAQMASMPMHGGGTAMARAMAAPPAGGVWSAEWLLLTVVMWSVMMVGMMLPSAAPAILMYGSIVRRNRERGRVLPSVWIFTAGYLAVWTAFSLAATLLQAALQAAALLTPMMASASGLFSGGLLIVAGVYQWLPIKEACLQKCRAPLQFFMVRWRPGAGGAFRMGVEHGAFCLGCCWALMLLLFTAGVMNLLWVAAIAAFVFAEKLLPRGPLVARLAGGAMMAAGAALIVTA
jgi:predicted metal-binding membrane protein